MDPFDLRQWKDFTSLAGSPEAPAIVDQVVIDSRRIDSPRALFVALKGKKEDGHYYVEEAARAGARFAIVSQEWVASSPLPTGLTLLKTSNPLDSLQSLAQAYRSHLPIKIIGIAGSFGKTMVKDLLHRLLSTQFNVASSPESFNSQIGVALSLLTLKKEHTFGIIEAAVSQRSEMDALARMIRPDYTVLTPTGKKHLATLRNLATLNEEILKLAQATSPQGWSLLQENLLRRLQQSDSSFPYYFWDIPDQSLPHVSFTHDRPLGCYSISFPDSNTFQGSTERGHAYILNLLNMAVKSSWLMGISSENIISCLKEYQPEPMRTETWKSSLGTLFINDSYCSDPLSIDHSLKHFDQASQKQQKIFVFGGMRENDRSSQTSYRRIGKTLSKSKIDNLYLVGNKPFSPLIDEVRNSSPETKILAFEDYPSIFYYLQERITGNDLILFKGENKIPFDKLTETFDDNLSNNQCTINLAAIETNLSLIRYHLPERTRIMVMVKALAYGTDDVRISKFLENNDVDILGVSYVDEAIALKRAGVRQAIFSISAAPYEAKKIVKWDLEVGVSSLHLIDALAAEATRSSKRVKVHLHIDTGMGRFGCRPEEALALARRIISLPSLEIEGIMTHFACAEDPKEDSFTLNQSLIFDKAIRAIEGDGIKIRWKHAANSSGALRFSFPHYNMVRLGLAIYGLYGSPETEKSIDLRLAIALTSRIVGINDCKKGDSVGYGRSYLVAREQQRIAVLPIGYFDGLHRHYSSKASVLIQGHKAPMVGTICMDNLMIDVTDIPGVEIGDKVLIFGEDEYGYYLSPEELASSGHSIVHELITCLGPRIPRIFIHEEGKQIR